MSLILKLAGILLLGAGLMVGHLDDMREQKRRDAEFHEEIRRLDEQIQGPAPSPKEMRVLGRETYAPR